MSRVLRVRCVDLETTGEAPPEHWPCEIGWVDVIGTPFASGHLWDVEGAPASTLCHPGRPIPPETKAIHHIQDGDLAGAPTWAEAAAAFAALPRPDAYAGHGVKKAERVWLTDDLLGPVPWLCSYKCGLRLWPDAPGHSNQCLRYWRDPVGLDRALAHPAHRAGPDAYVTAFHVRDLLERAERPLDASGRPPIEVLADWSGQPALQATCRIGQWRGKPWREVDDGFLSWVLSKDFDEDVVFTVEAERARRRAERDAQMPPPRSFPRQGFAECEDDD